MPPPPLKCENRVYVHSNFASSTAYLLGVLLPQHEPKTEFCLVKDDTVSLRDGYEDELHSLWTSLANPKAVLTLPRTTSLDPATGVPTSTPSPPSPVQSSLSLSFVYSPCSFWQEVQPDPLYPYLPSPYIDMAHAVRGFSRGWDYASLPYESVVYTPPKNNMPYRYTMKGQKASLAQDSLKRFKTFLQFGGGFGTEYRKRFGGYGLFKARTLEQFQSFAGLVDWRGRGMVHGEGASVVPVGEDRELAEEYSCHSLPPLACEYVPMYSSSPNHRPAPASDPKGWDHPLGSKNFRNFNPSDSLLPYYTGSERTGVFAFAFVALALVALVFLFGSAARKGDRVSESRRKAMMNPMEVMQAKAV